MNSENLRRLFIGSSIVIGMIALGLSVKCQLYVNQVNNGNQLRNNTISSDPQTSISPPSIQQDPATNSTIQQLIALKSSQEQMNSTIQAIQLNEQNLSYQQNLINKFFNQIVNMIPQVSSQNTTNSSFQQILALTYQQLQMNTTIQSQQQKLSDQQNLITQQQSQITTLALLINFVQSQLNIYTNIPQQITNLQSNLHQLNSSLNNLQQSIPATAQQQQQIMNDQQTQINNVKSQLNNFTNIPQQITNLSQNLNLLNSSLDSLQKIIPISLQQQQQQLNDQQSQLTKQSNWISSQTDQINNMKLQLNNQTSQISNLQQNLSQFNSSLVSIQSSIPTTTLYDIIYSKSWYDTIDTTQPVSSVFPDLSLEIMINTTSIVTATVIGHIQFNSNVITLCFSVNGIPISQEYTDLEKQNLKQFAYHYNWPENGYMTITLTQKIKLQPSTLPYRISLFAEIKSSSGIAIQLNGAGVQYDVQTVPKQYQR